MIYSDNHLLYTSNFDDYQIDYFLIIYYFIYKQNMFDKIYNCC